MYASSEEGREMTKRPSRQRRRWRRASIAVLAVAAVSVSLSACASNSPASSTGTGTGGTSTGGSSTGATTAPSSVSFGLGGGYLDVFMPYLIADGAGYFNQVATQFHTTINTVTYPDAAIAYPAFFAGSVQGLVTGISQMLSAKAAGQDISAVVNENDSLGTIVGAAEKYKSSKGTNLAAFNGATWCTTSIASTATTAMQFAAIAAGLDWSNQHVVALGSVSAFLPALQTGRCDVEGWDPTTAGKALSSDAGYIVDNLYSTGSIAKSGLYVAFPMMMSNAFITKYHALSVAIVAAMIKGLLTTQQYVNDPTKLYSLTPSEYRSSNTYAQFLASWNLVKGSYLVTDGEFTNTERANTIHYGQVGGALTQGQTVNGDEAFANTLVQEAYSLLGKTPHVPSV
jgi:NitT/TauT family transport system substrate-binding protein